MNYIPSSSTPPQSLDPALWELPGVHSIKAIGLSSKPIQDNLCEILHALGLKFEQTNIKLSFSKTKKYIVVTAKVAFGTTDEVKALYKRLFDHPNIVRAL